MLKVKVKIWIDGMKAIEIVSIMTRKEITNEPWIIIRWYILEPINYSS